MTKRASRVSRAAKPTPSLKQIEALRTSHEVVFKSWRCASSAEAMLRVVSSHMNTLQHTDAFDSDAFAQITRLTSAQVQEAIEALGSNGIAEVLHVEIGAVEAALFGVYGVILCTTRALEGRKPLKDGDFVDWPQGYALACASSVLADKCLPPLDRISTQLRSQIAEVRP